MTRSRALLLAVAMATMTGTAASQVRVVNVIPVMFGDETTANPEPTVAVNPRNPALIALSSFLMGTNVCAGSSRSPILISTDAGANWAATCKLSTPALGATPPGDVIMRWSGDGQRLYAAYIWPYDGGPLHTRVGMTADAFSPDTMRTLMKRDFIDQPDLLIVQGPSGDRILLAGSFKDINFGQAMVMRSDASARPGINVPLPLEHRKIAGENFSVRMAAHPSGRIYAVFNGAAAFGVNGKDSSVNILDITVVRDDSGAAGTQPFTALREQAGDTTAPVCARTDGGVGVRVARCRAHPNLAGLGLQRLAPVMLSIATDPSDAAGARVFVAWADSTLAGTTGASRITVHVARSDDAGASWRELIAIPGAINPALAVDDGGRVGLLFQQFRADSADPRWLTRLLIGERGELAQPQEYLLARTSPSTWLWRFQPFLGDYVELHAYRDIFLGVFSAANHPNPYNFPNGVNYQRRIDSSLVVLMKRNTMLMGSEPLAQVAPSIDPFFFTVNAFERPECAELRQAYAAAPPARRNAAQPPSDAATVTQRQMATLGCRWQ